MDINSRVFLAGHKGMVGSAFLKKFVQKGFKEILTADKTELDLIIQNDVFDFFDRNRPDYVVLAAAKVGGIQANIESPYTFLYDNLQIQNNVIQASVKYKVQKLIFLGSSCMYPKNCPQPMKIDHLLTGPFESTNEGYALAKVTGLRLLQAAKNQSGFQSLTLIPCNLYGPNDSFDLRTSHVLSALVRRFIEAKIQNQTIINLWGTGIARREFMHVDDLAEGMFHILENKIDADLLNIGVGSDISIKELAIKISQQVEFNGTILWDSSRPDGMLRKCLDVDEIRTMGFVPKINIDQGINQMIEIYKNILKGLE